MTSAAQQEDERVLLARARAGDEDAFGLLVAPYLRELHAHCYRMLGSVHDAEDVLQEVLVRAWRYLDTFDERGRVRGWLYRIATNRCLTARSRAAAAPAVSRGPAPPPSNVSDIEVAALEPYPDEWLRELAGNGDPAARYEVRESVQLAFLTVIQLLPPRQRAVLLLRDVLAFPAAETAHILRASEAAVNSTLQRARAALRAYRLVPTRANDQPAVAAYMRDGGIGVAYGMMVLTIQAGLIGEITGFADPSLFPLFGLLQQTPWPPGPER